MTEDVVPIQILEADIVKSSPPTFDGYSYSGGSKTATVTLKFFCDLYDHAAHQALEDIVNNMSDSNYKVRLVGEKVVIEEPKEIKAEPVPLTLSEGVGTW